MSRPATHVCQAEDCGTPTPDMLCKTHLRYLARSLQEFPVLIDELGVTASRQDRIRISSAPERTPNENDTHLGRAMADNYVTGEAEPLPYNVGAANARTTIHRVLRDWADVVQRWHVWTEPPGTTVTDLALWLAEYAPPWARTSAQGPQLAANVDYLVWTARRIIDRPPVRWFAGTCKAEVAQGTCEFDLYAQEDRDDVTCDGWRQGDTGCGAVHDVAARKALLVTELRMAILPLDLILDALPTLIGVSPDKSTVRSWRHRKQLQPAITGTALYRGGDVLDLAGELATRRTPQRLRKRTRAG